MKLPTSQRMLMSESYKHPKVAWTISLRNEHGAVDGQGRWDKDRTL